MEQIAISWNRPSARKSEILITWPRIADYANLDERWCRRLADRPVDPLPVANLLAEGARVCAFRAALDAWLERQRARRDGRRRMRTGVGVAA